MKNYREDVLEKAQDVDFSSKSYTCIFKTSVGEMKVELLPEKAPKHCENLIGLSKSGFYNGLKFHRVSKNFVAQAGCPHGLGTGGPGYRISPEFNDFPHDFGTLSMSRTEDDGSAGSQFFFCLDRHQELDRKFTAFGKVQDDQSQRVLKALGAAVTGLGDRPMKDVVIHEVDVVESVKAL